MKAVEGRKSRLNRRHHRGFFWEELRKTKRGLQQDNRDPCRVSIRTPPDHKSKTRLLDITFSVKGRSKGKEEGGYMRKYIIQ